ncbi:hypothetical protein ACOSQ2_003562 [Xanthoceras sorbifolium]
MLLFRIYVKYVNQWCDLHVIQPGHYSVINIINELSIIFPWTMQQHVLKTDEKLMAVFKVFDDRNFLSIEFELEGIS